MSAARPAADYGWLSATEVAATIAAGRLSPEHHLEYCLDRIKADDGRIGAWSFVDAEGAREQARRLHEVATPGPLHGICMGVKDVLDTCDMPTQHGAALYEGHQPSRDSACVAAVRASGAIVLGKTRPTEFASPIAVGVRNPLDITRSAGVSSSGSAAAVAAGMVPLALGTQTGGSIIRPASYCGIVGFKPSLTAIDRAGILHLRPSLDTVGLFARTVADAQLLFGALVPGMVRGYYEDGADPARVGVCRTGEWVHAKAEARKALAVVTEAARSAGAAVEDVDLPPIFQDALEAFRIIVTVETARAMATEFAAKQSRLNDWLRGIAVSARALTDARYREALDVAAECREALAPLFAKFDGFITPAAAGEAIARLDGLDDPWFCPLWTLMHGPALTFPAALGPSGLPVGIQLVGPPGADCRILALGEWLQATLVAHSVRG